MKPKTESELAEIVRDTKVPFDLIGTGAKRALGRPTQGVVLELSAFDQVHAYEPEELILEVGAGAKLATIQKLLAKQQQYFAFEPPDFSRLLGSKHAGTVGGMMACNLAGPRRLKAGAARDHVLGVRGVSGRGEIFKAGARVVKNVTGYDVPKLMVGSYGTLAALTSIIIKVLPSPETEETLVLGGLDDGDAIQAMAVAMQSSCEVSGAAHVPGQGTYLRLEGIGPSTAYRRDKLAQLFSVKSETLPAKASAALWKDLRDVVPLAGDVTLDVWRISVAPSDAPQVIAKLALDKRYYMDWAGGLIWLAVASGTPARLIRDCLISGHATLVRNVSQSVGDIFQPQPAALAALTRRVKTSFDPRGLFNPGRMYEGV